MKVANHLLDKPQVKYGNSEINSQDDSSYLELENRICHLKTFSKLSHRRYARILYNNIKKQLLITKNLKNKSALNKLAQIIELKIGTVV